MAVRSVILQGGQWIWERATAANTAVVLFMVITLLTVTPAAVLATTSSLGGVDEPTSTEASTSTQIHDRDTSIKQQASSPENYSGWTPPPPPDGVSIDPVEYLLLWDQSFTLEQAQVSLQQAGYSGSEVTRAAEDYRALTTGGRITTERPSLAKATWNSNIADLAPETTQSESHTKWNTDGASEIRDGDLYIHDAQLDLMTVEPSTTVLYSADGDPTTHESPRVYTAGDSVTVQGAFDYRIERPEDDTSGSRRTYYTLQDVEPGDFETTLDMVGSPAQYSQVGQVSSDTTGTSAVINTPGELTGAANLIGETSVTVTYEKRVEKEVCTADDDDDDRRRDDDDDDDDDSSTGADSGIGGSVPGAPSGGSDDSGGDDDGGDSGYSGGYGGGGGQSVSGQPLAETCTFETVSERTLTESVDLTASRTVYLANRDTVDVSYWEAPGEGTAGYIHVKTPDQWASVTLADGTTIEDPREITTQRDFSYAFERVFTDSETEFNNPNQPPVRNYYIARASGINIDRSQATSEAREEWQIGKKMATTTEVTQYPPVTIATTSDSGKQFQDTSSVTLQVDQRVANPETDLFTGDVSAAGVAPGQQLDVTTSEGGEVIEGNISADILVEDENTDTPEYRLEVKLTNEQTGEPISTATHENTEIRIRDVLGDENQTVDTGSDGTATISVEEPGAKQAVISSTFDPSEDVYIFEDTATAGYSSSSGFIWGTFMELLRIFLIMLPLIILISVVEYVITGKTTVLNMFK